MIKNMMVQVSLGDRVVTLEMSMKGDGIQAFHTYEERVTGDHAYIPKAKVLIENEEGQKGAAELLTVSKDGYAEFLVRHGQSNYPPHMMSIEAWKDTFFEPGTPNWEEYDKSSPFYLHGLGTVGKVLSVKEADEIARDKADFWGLSIEDHEMNELGHVYTLDNGSSLVIRGNGTLYVLDGTTDEE